MQHLPSLLDNLAAGSVLAVLTVLFHTVGLIAIASALPRVGRHLGFHENDVGRTFMMAIVVLGVLGILTLEVWTWAAAYAVLGVTTSFAESLWFSTALFSTVGYGGSSFDPGWRLLTALEGINGFLMIGWPTAYLVRASTRHGPFRGDHF